MGSGILVLLSWVLSWLSKVSPPHPPIMAILEKRSFSGTHHNLAFAQQCWRVNPSQMRGLRRQQQSQQLVLETCHQRNDSKPALWSGSLPHPSTVQRFFRIVP